MPPEEQDLYKELLSLQQKLHEDQLDTVKKRVGEINVQLESIVKTLQELAIQQAKVEQHIERVNGDHIHHISPCTRLTEAISQIENTKKFVEEFKNYVIEEFKNVESDTDKDMKDVKTDIVTDTSTAITNALAPINTEITNIKALIAAHTTKHFSIIQLALAIIGSVIVSSSLIFAIIKWFFGVETVPTPTP